MDSRPDYERMLFENPIRAHLMEQIGEANTIVLRSFLFQIPAFKDRLFGRMLAFVLSEHHAKSARF